MSAEAVKCVLLANQHHGLSEGIRHLLETEFDAVLMVADEVSLVESAARMKPSVVVADLALAQGEAFGWLRRLRARCPESRVIILSVHEESCVVQAAFEAGAKGFVLKRNLASELKDAVDAVLSGKLFPDYSNRPQDSSPMEKPIPENRYRNK